MKKLFSEIIISGADENGIELACFFSNFHDNIILLSTDKNISEEELKSRISDGPLWHKENEDNIKIFQKEHFNFDSQDCWFIDNDSWEEENVTFVDQLITKYHKKFTFISSVVPSTVYRWLSGKNESFINKSNGLFFSFPGLPTGIIEIIQPSNAEPDTSTKLKNWLKRCTGKNIVLSTFPRAFVVLSIGIFYHVKAFQAANEYQISMGKMDALTGYAGGLTDKGFVSLLTKIDYVNKIIRNWYKLQKTFISSFLEKKELSLLLELKTVKKKKIMDREIRKSRRFHDPVEKIKFFYNRENKTGEFFRDFLSAVFWYSAQLVSAYHISLSKLDQIFIEGWGWRTGPFQLWQKLGIEKVADEIKKAEYQLPEWIESFIRNDQLFCNVVEGQRIYADPYDIDYKDTGLKSRIFLSDLKPLNALWQRNGASIIDLGDNILALEFHTKMNMMDEDVIAGMDKILLLATQKKFQAVVIGNQGRNFSVGVNLGLLFLSAIEKDYDHIDYMVRLFQDKMLAFKYAPLPVVVAVHGLTIGGGCELSLQSDAIVADINSNIGLVETRAGLIPAGGGTKCMAEKAFEFFNSDTDQWYNIFLNIAQAKFSRSGLEAKEMKILSHTDKIILNKSKLIFEAKNKAIALAKDYKKPDNNKIKVTGKKGFQLIEERYLSKMEHSFERKLANKAAYVFCGGSSGNGDHISEREFLDIEREVFLSLMGEKETLKRIWKIIKGK